MGGILKTREPKMLDLPTPEELFVVNNYVKRRKLSLVKTNIFRRMIQLALHKTVRPPTKKHLGTRLRMIDPLPCILELFHELTSIERGLPADSPQEGIKRSSPPGYPQRKTTLLPVSTSAAREVYKLKLQRQDATTALCRFEEFDPRASLGALRMLMKKEKIEGGQTVWICKKFCMASQVSLKLTQPVGKATADRFAMISGKLNVLVMDTATAQITFGVVNYEPWVKKWLRWEMYDQVEKLAARPNLRATVPGELLLLIRERKADPIYARVPNWEEVG